MGGLGWKRVAVTLTYYSYELNFCPTFTSRTLALLGLVRNQRKRKRAQYGKKKNLKTMRRYPAGSVVLAGFSQGAGLAMAAAAAECAWSPVLGGGVVQPFFSSLGVDLRSTVVINRSGVYYERLHVCGERLGSRPVKAA